MIEGLIEEASIVVKPNDRLSSVIPKMKDAKIHTAPVTNERGKLVGVVDYRELLRRRAPLGSRVSSVMLPPHSLTLNMDLDTVVRRFYEVRLREYPVVDESGKLIGIIPRFNLLKAIEGYVSGLKVSEYMANPPIIISPSDDVARARWIMVKHGIGRLPVVDGNRLVGIITLTDLIEKIYYVSIPRRSRRGEVSGEEEFLAAPVGNVMSTNVYSIRPEDNLAKAIDEMVSRRVTGLVVVNDSGSVVGVLSGSDVLKAYMDSRKVKQPLTAKLQIDDSMKPLIERVVNNHLEKIAKLVEVIDFKIDVRSRDSGRRFEVSVRLKDRQRLHTASAMAYDPVSAVKEAMDKVYQSILKGVRRSRERKRRPERGESTS